MLCVNGVRGVCLTGGVNFGSMSDCRAMGGRMA